jgi:hypothetical protein
MKALVAVVAGLGFVSAASAGIVMDFQDLESTGGGFTDVGNSYIAGDFEVWQDPSEPFTLKSPHTDNATFYQGSTGLFNDTVGGIIHFDRVDGGAFDMESIDLASLFVGSGNTTINVVGMLSGGGTVNAAFTTSNGGSGFETFSFAGLGFNSVVEVTWVQDGNLNFHQFDNIGVIPAPSALALLGLGGLAIRRRH